MKYAWLALFCLLLALPVAADDSDTGFEQDDCLTGDPLCVVREKKKTPGEKKHQDKAPAPSPSPKPSPAPGPKKTAVSERADKQIVEAGTSNAGASSRLSGTPL